MTTTLQAAASLTAWTAAGWVFRVLIDPRRSVVTVGRRIVAWLDSRAATRVVQVMAMVALLVSFLIGYRQYELASCVARYNEASNVSQRARAQAAETDRRAQDELFRAIADDPRQAIAKLRIYNASRAQADAQRASNPVPPPPSTSCG
jgi:hypothetical protein